MKKAFLILIFLIIGIVSGFTQTTTYFKAFEVNGLTYEGEWGGWQDCEVYLEVIPNTRRFIIHTEDPRIVDYGRMKEVKTKDYDLYIMEGTDTEYELIRAEWYFYKSKTIILKLTKGRVMVKYNLQQL